MSQIVPDTQHRGLVSALPPTLRDLALLARLDRPIGWWLLFWPGAWGVLLAGGQDRWGLIAWLLLGAIAMRGAGCVYNDIVDADIDRQVARTAARPVASGRVSGKAAWAWLLALCLVGLVVLLQLRWQAQVVALASVAPVAAYPFMKPHHLVAAGVGWAWSSSWAALVGWVEVRGAWAGDWGLPALALLYAGSIAWVIGYDTIYALQDREDDALVGVRSSALRMGQHVRGGVAMFYAVAVACWTSAFWLVRPDWLALLALAPMALHLAWQVLTLELSGEGNAIDRFRANRFAGLLMALACWVVGNA